MSRLREWRSPSWRWVYQGTVLATGLVLPVFTVAVAVSGAPTWQKVGFGVIALPCWAYQLRWLPRLWAA